MEKVQCTICSYIDTYPFIFEWEEGCPICGAEKGLIEESTADEEEEEEDD
jgi:alpha-D-ribose 1-methylphosphonate 5-phosphate C-P lyase